MRLRFSVDLRDFLSATEKMFLQGRLGDFAAKTLAISMRSHAGKQPRKKIGTSVIWAAYAVVLLWGNNPGRRSGPARLGQEIAEGVRSRTEGTSVTVAPMTDATNRLAQHVHEGGVFRPRNTKFLAIPVDPLVRGEYASDHIWHTANGKWLFIREKTARRMEAGP